MLRLLLLTLLAPLLVAQPLISHEWTSYHGPDGQTRGWPSSTPTTTDGSVKWTFTADAPIASPSISADNTVYFITCNSSLYAVHGANGTVRWRVTLPYSDMNCFDTSPSLGHNGMLYVCINNYTLYALNATTGEHVWQRRSSSETLLSSPVVDGDGNVYTGFGMPFCSFDGMNGATRWCHELQDAVDGPATLSRSGLVLAVTSGGAVFADDTTSGKRLWHKDLSAVSYGGPVLDAAGAVYVGIGGALYALAANGSVLWMFQTRGLIQLPPVLANGAVYVGSQDGGAYAIHASNGSLKWVFSTQDVVDSGPAVGTDGSVYVGTSNGSVYALEGGTGRMRWQYAMPGNVQSPALGPDGTLYAPSGGAAQVLVAFGARAVSA